MDHDRGEPVTVLITENPHLFWLKSINRKGQVEVFQAGLAGVAPAYFDCSGSEETNGYRISQMWVPRAIDMFKKMLNEASEIYFKTIFIKDGFTVVDGVNCRFGNLTVKHSSGFWVQVNQNLLEENLAIADRHTFCINQLSRLNLPRIMEAINTGRQIGPMMVDKLRGTQNKLIKKNKKQDFNKSFNNYANNMSSPTNFTMYNNNNHRMRQQSDNSDMMTMISPRHNNFHNNNNMRRNSLPNSRLQGGPMMQNDYQNNNQRRHSQNFNNMNGNTSRPNSTMSMSSDRPQQNHFKNMNNNNSRPNSRMSMASDRQQQNHFNNMNNNNNNFRPNSRSLMSPDRPQQNNFNNKKMIMKKPQQSNNMGRMGPPGPSGIQKPAKPNMKYLQRMQALDMRHHGR